MSDTAHEYTSHPVDVLSHRISPLLPLVADYFHQRGTWPNCDQLQRTLARQGVDLDVYAEVAALDSSLGFRDPSDNTIVLTVRGLGASDRCHEELNCLVEAINAFVDAYLGEDSDPQVTELDLRVRLGLKGIAETKVRALLDRFGYINHGWGERDGFRFWRVSHGAARFRQISTPEALIQQLEELDCHRHPVLAGSPPRGTYVLSDEPSGFQIADLDVLELDDLHPAVADAAREFLRTSKPSTAIVQASKALTALLRAKTDLRLDGTRLVEGAFHRLALADLSTQTGRNIQEGTRQLALGVMRLLRNVNVHEELEFSAAEMMEALAVISIVARRVDAAALRQESGVRGLK